MTQELKNLLKLYLTNELKYESKPLDTEQPFKLYKTMTNTINSELDTKYPNGWTLGKDWENSTYRTNNEIDVAFGNYTDDDDIEKGFFLLLKEGEIIQIIDKYDTGTKIGYIEALATDEDNEFYGVIKGNDFTTYYLTLLNNITIKSSTDEYYSVKRRISYSLADYFSTSEQPMKIIKSTNSSNYLIYNTTKMILLNAEVGESVKVINIALESGEFKTASYSTLSVNEESKTINYYTSNSGYLSIYEGTATDSTTSLTLSLKKKIAFDTNGTSTNLASIVVKGNNIYVMNTKIRNDNNKELDIWFIDKTTYEVNLIEDRMQESVSIFPIRGALFYVNGTIFVTINNIYGDYDVRHSIGIINDENETSPYLYTFDNVYSTTYQPIKTRRIISIAQSYNLIKIAMFSDENIYLINGIYNQGNYNGVMYKTTNLFIPRYATLYEDEVAIFSRNLYNKTINNNTTTSTIEVPNLYLNDNNITGEDLVSETSLTINNNEEFISKNIYETLYINFINTIRMKNITNFNEEISRDEEAMVLNQEMTWGLTNTSVVNKYRLVNRYSEEIKEFAKSEIEQIDDLTARYTISLFTAEEPIRIELINNNENFVYATIDCSRMEQGKFYKVTQDLVIN